MLERIPDQSLLAGTVSNRAIDRLAATRGSSGSYAFIYLPAGQTRVTVNTGRLSGTTLATWWYDPRTGEAKAAETFAKVATRSFTTPTTGSGDDWVLVLDDTAAKFAPPGRAQPALAGH
jgi:hypothetical protein